MLRDRQTILNIIEFGQGVDEISARKLENLYN